jgi:hypothetical protein
VRPRRVPSQRVRGRRAVPSLAPEEWTGTAGARNQCDLAGPARGSRVSIARGRTAG